MAPHHLVGEEHPVFVKEPQAEDHALSGWIVGVLGDQDEAGRSQPGPCDGFESVPSRRALAAW